MHTDFQARQGWHHGRKPKLKNPSWPGLAPVETIAVFDLAPKSRLGVGPASRTDGVMAGVKRRRQTTIHSPSFGFGILPGVCGNLPRSGRTEFFPAVEILRSLRPKSGRREGRLAGQMPKQFAVPVCVHAAGQSLSPPDSDGGTERNGA